MLFIKKCIHQKKKKNSSWSLKNACRLNLRRYMASVLKVDVLEHASNIAIAIGHATYLSSGYITKLNFPTGLPSGILI